MSRLSKTELEARAREIVALIHDGEDPPGIIETLNLSEEEFEAGLKLALDNAAALLRSKPTEHVYAQLLLDLAPVLRKLATLARDDKTQARDAVTALRAQAEIRLRIIKEGRDLGVIDTGKLTDESGDMALLATLQCPEIKAKLYAMLSVFHAQDSGLGAGFLEARSGPLFSGPSAFQQEKDN